MPPLAAYLAPQIMAKAKEVEAQLGPPTAGYLADVGEYGAPALGKAPGVQMQPEPALRGVKQRRPPKTPLPPAREQKPKRTRVREEGAPERIASNAGYLSSTAVGFEKTPYDPRGLMNKPEGKFYDQRTPAGAMLEGLAVMNKSGDPIAQKVANAMRAGYVGKVGTQGGTRPGYEPPMLIPNAGQSGNAPIGMNERGEPIFAELAPAPRPRLQLKKGEAAGFDEKGESVDPKGKKLGYLKTGDKSPLRDLARRKEDVGLTKDRGFIDRDAFGAEALKQNYGEHLKAAEDYFSDTGKEGFPAGYFNGMSAEQKQKIKIGVDALRAMNRGERT